MIPQWVRAGAAGVTLSILAAACGADRPTGVSAAGPALKKMKMEQTYDTVTVVSRLVPLDGDLAASAVIGAAGGTLELPAAGLRLIVPRGAVASNVTFTVTAYPGTLLAYEFGPHGTTFATPVRVEQNLKDIVIPADVPVFAGYFPAQPDLLVDDVVGTIKEKHPATLDLTGGKVRFDVPHFSGYLVATGRGK